MLQAIISKKINGGTIKVISDFVDNHHEIVVLNTGQLNGYNNEDARLPNEQGFGIRSTQDRLNMLYQGKASFAIRNYDTEMVESKITMPLAII